MPFLAGRSCTGFQICNCNNVIVLLFHIAISTLNILKVFTRYVH